MDFFNGEMLPVPWLYADYLIRCCLYAGADLLSKFGARIIERLRWSIFMSTLPRIECLNLEDLRFGFRLWTRRIVHSCFLSYRPPHLSVSPSRIWC